MGTYDPLKTPDPAEWLELDESDRMFLVQDYHKKARIRLPNRRLHAVAHAIVENQLALDDPPEVRPTLRRLMSEGLDRHDAVHAIGFVLVGLMHEMVKDGKLFDSKEYATELSGLTPNSWRRMAAE